jgi:hypothetical protein
VAYCSERCKNNDWAGSHQHNCKLLVSVVKCFKESILTHETLSEARALASALASAPTSAPASALASAPASAPASANPIPVLELEKKTFLENVVNNGGSVVLADWLFECIVGEKERKTGIYSILAKGRLALQSLVPKEIPRAVSSNIKSELLGKDSTVPLCVLSDGDEMWFQSAIDDRKQPISPTFPKQLWVGFLTRENTHFFTKKLVATQRTLEQCRSVTSFVVVEKIDDRGVCDIVRALPGQIVTQDRQHVPRIDAANRFVVQNVSECMKERVFLHATSTRHPEKQLKTSTFDRVTSLTSFGAGFMAGGLDNARPTNTSIFDPIRRTHTNVRFLPTNDFSQNFFIGQMSQYRWNVFDDGMLMLAHIKDTSYYAVAHRHDQLSPPQETTTTTTTTTSGIVGKIEFSKPTFLVDIFDIDSKTPLQALGGMFVGRSVIIPAADPFGHYRTESYGLEHDNGKWFEVFDRTVAYVYEDARKILLVTKNDDTPSSVRRVDGFQRIVDVFGVDYATSLAAVVSVSEDNKRFIMDIVDVETGVIAFEKQWNKTPYLFACPILSHLF